MPDLPEKYDELLAAYNEVFAAYEDLDKDYTDLCKVADHWYERFIYLHNRYERGTK